MRRLVLVREARVDDLDGEQLLDRRGAQVQRERILAALGGGPAEAVRQS